MKLFNCQNKLSYTSPLIQNDLDWKHAIKNMHEWNEMELVMWGPIEGFIHLQDLQASY